MNITELAEAAVRPSHARSALVAGGVSIHSYRASVSTEVIDAVQVLLRLGAQTHELVLERDNIHVQLIEGDLARRTLLPRCWTRVTLIECTAHEGPSQLVLEHMGQAIELGEFLDELPRQLLAEWLQRLIGPMGTSPPLSVALGYHPSGDVDLGPAEAAIR